MAKAVNPIPARPATSAETEAARTLKARSDITVDNTQTRANTNAMLAAVAGTKVADAVRVRGGQA